MNWSLSLLLFLIFSEVALYCVYKRVRKLPLIKNKLFERLAVFIIVMSIYILVETMISRGGSFMGIRAYFIRLTIMTIIIEYLFSIITLYALYYLGVWKSFWGNRMLFRIPIISVILLSATSPWTHFIGFIGEGNTFVKGPLYWTLYFVPVVYVGVFIYFFIKHKKEVSFKNTWGIWAAIASASFGLLINYLTNSIIVINFYFAVAEYIIYLKMCNPKLFCSRSTNTFNRAALLYMVDELHEKDKKLYIGGIKLSNYQSVIERIGIFRFDHIINLITEWVQKIYPNMYVFYIGTKQVIFISEEPVDHKLFLEQLKKRFTNPFSVEDYEAFLQVEPFAISRDVPYTELNKFFIYADYILGQRELDSDQVFVITKENINDIEQIDKLKQVLTRKIKEKDLIVYYQPLYSTESKKITCAEALVRIYDEELGLIMPYKFIPLAESSGEILDLGMIVFEKVCQYIQTHDLEEMGLEFININVSPLQFQDLQLVEKFKKIADWYGVDLSLIEFEITESVILKEQLVDYQINEFSKYNAKLAIDDFGMGSSNMQRLVKYPFSSAKLDMSLVWSYFKGENHIMEHVIQIFKDQNLTIVAEGVENKQMVEKLSEFSCEYLQGYYFSKPIAAHEFDLLVKKYNQ